MMVPTRHAVHVALAGAVAAGVELVTGQAALVAWGASMVVGIAIARAATLASVTRIRAAGFEMLWHGSVRTVKAVRGREIVLEAEVRNRDTLAARFVGLRAIGSSQLKLRVEPSEGEVAASGLLKVKVHVEPKRVGQHGIFGLALELRGAPGLFEVPLTFANPFGVQVLPTAYSIIADSARGGRARLAASASRSGKARGDGSDLRELREYVSGDPFKRIAWRASARRGKLLVREVEREERDLVWIVLDASVELWSGPSGVAPLDLAIEDAASLVQRHLQLGDPTGLAMIAGRVLRWVEPESGPAHAASMMAILATGAGTYDQDRSELDEADVALRVIEHLRPLDARGLADVSRRDLDRLAQRAVAVLSRAPFDPLPPAGQSPREQLLRRYLAAFGIESPAKLDSERARSDLTLADTLSRIASGRVRPTLVYVLSPAPEPVPLVVNDALKKLRRHGVEVRWNTSSYEPSLRAIDDGRAETKHVIRAMLARARLSKERGEKSLRHAGIRLARGRARRAEHPPEEHE
ncbi:MAG: DUF58 domain-containing protein [Polyangiaceae bacterium]